MMRVHILEVLNARLCQWQGAWAALEGRSEAGQCLPCSTQFPHQSANYRIKGAFDVKSEASPELCMLAPGHVG